MGRSLTASIVNLNDDALFTVADTKVSAGDLVFYAPDGRVTTEVMSSTITVRGPKLVSSADSSLLVNNNTGFQSYATDTLTNENLAVVYNNASNSGRCSVCVVSPAGAVVVPAIQLSTGAAQSCAIQSLSGGGFAVAFMNGDGTIIAVYQNDGTQVLAPTQVAATSFTTAVTVKLCRGMTDGTGFIVMWAETASTSLRCYSAAGVFQQSTTTAVTGPAASAMNGYGNRFDLIRHPVDGQIYLAMFNADASMSVSNCRIQLQKLHPQTLASGGNGAHFYLSLNSMSMPYVGIVVIPRGEGIFVAAKVMRFANNDIRCAVFVNSFNSSLQPDVDYGTLYGEAWDAVSGTSINGSLSKCFDHTTGDSAIAIASFDNSTYTAQLLEFPADSDLVFERDVAQIESATYSPNLSLALTSSGCVLSHPINNSASTAAKFHTFSFSPEVNTATASYASLGLGKGVTAGSLSYASTPLNLSRMLTYLLPTTAPDNHRMMVATMTNGGFAVAANSRRSNENTYSAYIGCYSPSIIVCNAAGLGLFAVHILPLVGKIYSAYGSGGANTAVLSENMQIHN